MSHKILFVSLLVFFIATLSVTIVSAQGPKPTPPKPKAPTANAGTAFTYQGQLKNNGALVNGTCDFRFNLYDAATGGNLIAGPTTETAIPIANGLFTTTIDFGANAFTGDARWLHTAVACPSGGSFTPLGPRQGLTPVPMAFSLPGFYTQQNATSPNVIGGLSTNNVANGVFGATISGGGYGGCYNYIGGSLAAIGGGQCNFASGYAATVPGGIGNSAQGDYSFAAGNQAQAQNIGAFVWADSTSGPFGSTNNNQFLIRATGGVGINTNTPGDQLEVYAIDSTIRVRNSNDTGGIFVGDTHDALQLGLYNPSGSTWGNISANTKQSFFGVDKNGKVCSLNNSFPNGMACRNILDDGYGNLQVQGGLSVKGGGIAFNTIGAADTNRTLCWNSYGDIADCASSVRFKNNIMDLALGLDIVAKLRPVTFDWKSDGEHDLGFVAEEVNQVAPILTTRDKDGQVQGVKYGQVTAVLVKGMQEQQQQIADLKAQNASLQSSVFGLQSQNAVLEKQNADIEARLTTLEQAVKANGQPSHADAESVPATWVLFGGLTVVGLVVVRRRE